MDGAAPVTLELMKGAVITARHAARAEPQTRDRIRGSSWQPDSYALLRHAQQTSDAANVDIAPIDARIRIHAP